MIRRRQAIDVAAAVIEEDGRYLITLRPPDSHCGSLWEFPGGKRLPGESLEHCLCREIREELRLEIAVGTLMDKTRHSYPDRDVLLHFFRCQRLSGDPQALGCTDLRWVTPQEMTTLPFPEADAKLVAKLLQSAEEF